MRGERARFPLPYIDSLDRVLELDPENQSVTLKTLFRAAEILGMRVQIELVDT